MPSTLPTDVGAVGFQQGVTTQQGQFLFETLRHQHSVEGIPMVKRQCFQSQDVGRFDGQQFGPERGHMPRQILGRRFGKRELAYLHFGYDLPNTGDAQK